MRHAVAWFVAREWRRGGFLLGLVWLLTACAAPLPRVDTSPEAQRAFDQRAAEITAIEEWRLAARLGLSRGEEYWSAQLNWRAQAGSHVLDLSGPMGRGGGRLTLTEGQEARLMTRTGEQFHAPDPDTLMVHATGETIPVAGMLYWVRGLVAPGMAYTLDLDQDGRALRIEQSGWKIEYHEYMEVAGRMLPTRMDLQRGEVELRARLGGWNLGTDP